MSMVLVTGGTGFVGGWAIVELLKRGYNVRTTIRDPKNEDRVRRAVTTRTDAGDRLSMAVADMTTDDGWDVAVSGCDGVLHIASPMGAVQGVDLVATARDGAMRVLRAAAAGFISRVVMTSSAAACTPEKPLDRPIDETDWTDPEQRGLAEYRKSKTLAERDAWDFIATQPHTKLTTILPGAIFGPVLDRTHLGSVGIIDRLLKGQPPALPRLGFNITDVRDLAALHVRALESPAAAGERFITMGDSIWYADVAQILRERLGPAAARTPTADMPDLVARGLAAVNVQMKALLPLLGRTQAFSSEGAPAARIRSTAGRGYDCGLRSNSARLNESPLATPAAPERA